MSTASLCHNNLEKGLPSRVKCISFLKSKPRSFAAWRHPLSERQINMYFETVILPELSVLLAGAFSDKSDLDCEEAVQDATCQALEAFRILRLHENIRTGTARNEVALVLAKYASSQYMAGIRFANPRSDSSL